MISYQILRVYAAHISAVSSHTACFLMRHHSFMEGFGFSCKCIRKTCKQLCCERIYEIRHIMQ